ncbi:lactate utilization protein C [Streptomyces sp. NPDC007818]|uniref:LutC/YkgG family protein n=1 Tax=Streptomyces sp. NPDC007818 TaxID=3364780 RepID=UPI00368349FD
MTTPQPSSRDRILAKVRKALASSSQQPSEPSRSYLTTHTPDDPEAVLDLLHENLADYRAIVHRSTETALPDLISRILTERGARSVAVPAGLDDSWLAASNVELRPETATPTADALNVTDAVVTGCAVAVAETGTIVLDAGPGQGQRILTLVPDLHICVIRSADQVVASIPQAMPRLDPARPLTWISGPSATSDIELDRVEGVHGPRTLEVILLV